ncbi:hypothetical protein TorRG33x02_028370 [Trema orientale]|uniref:Uncharacterized protein n=1 Tax=Trema orientale TaxID=63057 RepID=A0A2P5FUR9_TREOI|nr:hypothetical protein TorRG33x02_028370 [Trema orientale]
MLLIPESNIEALALLFQIIYYLKKFPKITGKNTSFYSISPLLGSSLSTSINDLRLSTTTALSLMSDFSIFIDHLSLRTTTTLPLLSMNLRLFNRATPNILP